MKPVYNSACNGNIIIEKNFRSHLVDFLCLSATITATCHLLVK